MYAHFPLMFMCSRNVSIISESIALHDTRPSHNKLSLMYSEQRHMFLNTVRYLGCNYIRILNLVQILTG